MIEFRTIAALQPYIKVNAEIDIEYLQPFISAANTSLDMLVGADVSSLSDDMHPLLNAACRRYVAAKAMLMSKGMQNVKLTSNGFTRYSDSSKNVIAASSDAMNKYADDLAAYVDFAIEALLTECETLSTWDRSPKTTLMPQHWLRNADEVQKYTGESISRLAFRTAIPMVRVYERIVETRIGSEICTAIAGASSDEHVALARNLYRTVIASAVLNRAYLNCEDCRQMLSSIIIEANSNAEVFGITSADYGVANMKGGIML